MKKFDKTLFVIAHSYNQQTQSCLICLEPITNPVECNKCLTLFCKKCAQKWKSNHNQCPKKCSNQWKLNQVKSLNIFLRCPYQNYQCLYMVPEEFQIHYKICKKSPFRTQKTKTQLKEQYLCQYGHNLLFIHLKNQQLFYKDCAQCQYRRISRSICVTCQQNQEQKFVYCIVCRYPPIKSTFCPYNHQFKLRIHNLNGFNCACCARIFNQNQNYCYNDIECKYALCTNCFNKLPESQKSVAYEIEQESRQVTDHFYGNRPMTD